MQDEEMDHMDEIIRVASNSYHPAYDDKAWDKMDALLDKHLPQRVNKRRPVAFILFLLFILGSIGVAVLNPWNDRGHQPTTSQPVAVIPHLASEKVPIVHYPGNSQPGVKNKSGTTGITATPNETDGSPSTGYKKLPGVMDFDKKGHAGIKNGIAGIESGTSIVTDGQGDSDNSQNLLKGRLLLEDGSVDQPLPSVAARVSMQPIDFAVHSAVLVNAKISADHPLSANQTKRVKSSKTATGKTGFANNFAVTFSAGPDLSFVRLNDPGKTGLIYGAGLSYTMKQRLTVRAGFYKANKIYDAQPGDYHPPYSYWTYNTHLERVDADCDVYEIPFSLGYHFLHSKKHNWFAGMGISSYLMKRETYNYLYKNQQGQTMYRGWTLHDKNKHYFSVLGFSGGYQYHFNKRISLTAEPYFKLPLQGIGFGKIKLNSGGILISANIKPFVKK